MIAPPPFRTPIVDIKSGFINQPVWVRWLTAVLQIVNQQEGASLTANLPANPVVGMIVAVSDSTTTTWGATIAGGGTNAVLGWWNGANWTVIGK